METKKKRTTKKSTSKKKLTVKNDWVDMRFNKAPMDKKLLFKTRDGNIKIQGEVRKDDIYLWFEDKHPRWKKNMLNLKYYKEL